MGERVIIGVFGTGEIVEYNMVGDGGLREGIVGNGAVVPGDEGCNSVEEGKDVFVPDLSHPTINKISINSNTARLIFIVP